MIPNSENLPPVLTKTELLKLGWTAILIEQVLGKPDKVQACRRGYIRWDKHLYGRDRVLSAMRDERFLAHAAKRTARLDQLRQKREAIAKSYANWQDALPEACAGMFSLNRYAKHRNCGALHRTEIYRLENDLIKLLHSHGYVKRSWIHQQVLEAQLCHGCGGAGDEDCDRCGGTGIWRHGRTFEFWCFEFEVVGTRYCWHQPRHLVTEFQPLETVPPQDWQGLGSQEKPVKLPRYKFAAAKRLIAWVIDQASAMGNGSQQPQIEKEKEEAAGSGMLPFEFCSGGVAA